jgi:hypothetical protein
MPDSLISSVGRGYSDLCAALCAASVDAQELQIWKEVDVRQQSLLLNYLANVLRVSSLLIQERYGPQDCWQLSLLKRPRNLLITEVKYVYCTILH